MEPFQENIIKHMEKHNLTYKELSKRVDIPLSTLWNYVNKNNFIRPENIRKLTKYFKITKEEFYYNDSWGGK